MVFESIVVELINKYLGDYIERLDTSQLSIGLLGGNATLENLDIKANAFDDLDLPVKVLQGHISKLTLKIPFKHLYSEPVIAELDGLYVLVVPNAAIGYNDEKERRYILETKKKELRKIDEAKAKAAERSGKVEEKKDGFAEKFAAQVLKNLQISIKSIHIRYEDSYTIPGRSFACGFTLHNLSFQTTDKQGNPITIKDDAIKKFHKLVILESLAVYWNSEAKSYANLGRGPLKNMMRSTIIGPDNPKQDFDYIIRPISSSAMMNVNMRPDLDNFTIPQMVMDLQLKDIRLSLIRSQYCDVTAFLEATDRSWTQNKYRKYRPTVPMAKNYTIWWRYPYHVILEETVRRRKRMWSWSNMSRHRRLCRQYIQLWEKKMMGSKMTPDELRTIEMSEEELDVLNITLCRQQAELKVQKLQKTQKSKQSSGGFLGGWFRGSSGQNAAPATDAAAQITEKLSKEMTAEEKAKLFTAIGYSEQGGAVDLPKDFVSIKCTARLDKFSFTLASDNKSRESILVRVSVNQLAADVDQRSGANAIKVMAEVQSMEVTGIRDSLSPALPTLVSTQYTSKKSTLLKVSFETNPLDESADQKISLTAEPLQIIYDAVTINEVVKFMTPPEDFQFHELSTTVLQSLEDVKEMTTSGLKHMVSKRQYAEIFVDLKPSYFILPEGGSYKPDCRLLLADLGSFHVESAKTTRPEDGKVTTYDQIKEEAYDKFLVQLSSIQLLMIEKGQNWQEIRKLKQSPNHILRPFGFSCTLKKCIVTNDAKLPKIAIDGCLPILAVDISDHTLKSMLELVLHIPFPEPAAEERPPIAGLAPPVAGLSTRRSSIASSIMGFGSVAREDLNSRQYTASRILRAVKEVEGSSDEDSDSEFQDADESVPGSVKKIRPNTVELDLVFVIQSVELYVSSCEELASEKKNIFNLILKQIGTTVTKRRYDQQIQAYLGSALIEVPQFKEKGSGKCVALMNTEGQPDASKLLFIKLLIAEKTAPNFLVEYKNTRHQLDCDFNALEVCLHQESLVLLLTFLNALSSVVNPPDATEKPESWAAKVGDTVSISSGSKFGGSTTTAVSKVGAIMTEKNQRIADRLAVVREAELKGVQVDIAEVSITQWHVNAKVEKVRFVVCSEAAEIARITVKQLKADVQVNYRTTEVSLTLSDLDVRDSTPDILYKKIVWTEPNESIFVLNMVLNKETTRATNLQQNLSAFDTSISLQVGKINVVFLYLFISRLLNFLENFQIATQAAASKAQELHDATLQHVQFAVETPSEERTKLDIRVQAPVIFMPQNSASTNTLMLDLGFLRVSNSFIGAGASNAIAEKMMIKLDNLKVSRAVIIEATIKGEKAMIKPINVELCMTRNLSASWYHDIPNIDIAGNMKSVNVGLTQDDYQMIMETLQQNLEEKAPPTTTVDKSIPALPVSDNATTATANKAKNVSGNNAGDDKEDSAPSAPGEPSKPKEVWTAMKFHFNMDSVRLDLFKGETALGEWSDAVSASRNLAIFNLSGMKVGGFIKTDNVTNVDIRLASFVITDSRPGSADKINEILKTEADHTEPNGESHDLLQIKYLQDASENKDVFISVHSIYVCVCLDYMMTIADFFLKSKPEPVKAPAIQNSKAISKVKTKKGVAKPPPVETRTSELSLKLLVAQPEIVLVEDISKFTTNCIIARTEVEFAFHQKLECDIMNARIYNMQVFYCPFDVTKRAKNTLQIVHPTELHLYTNAPIGTGIHGNLHMEKLLIDVTPATIQSLAIILNSVTTVQEAEKVAEEENNDNLVDDDFWKDKEYTTDFLPFLGHEPEAEEAVNVDEVESGFDVANMLNEIEERRNELVISYVIMFRINEVTVTLESELGGKCIPMLVFESSMEGEIKNPSTAMSISMVLEAAVSYFNDSINVWEPLLETYPDQNNRRWTLDVEMLSADDSNLFEEDDWQDLGALQPSKNLILVSSKDSLEFTLSKTSLGVLSNLGKSFTDAYLLVDMAHEDHPAAQYIIQNQSGTRLDLTLENKFQWPERVDTEGKVSLEHNSDIGLMDNEADASAIQTNRDVIRSRDLRKIWFAFENHSSTEFLIQRSEVRVFQYEDNEGAKNSIPRQLCVEVSAFLGSKRIIFRSIVKVENKTVDILEIHYQEDSGKFAYLTDVAPNDSYTVPMQVVYTQSASIFLKPKLPGFELSSTGAQWVNHKKEDGRQTLECPGTNGIKHFYSVGVQVADAVNGNDSDKKSNHYIMTVRSPVALHNQLPLPISFVAQSNKGELNPGCSASICNVNTGSFVDISFEYNKKEWLTKFELDAKSDELSVISFESRDGYSVLVMDMGVHFQNVENHFNIYIYSPYWMINKTGLKLTYKANDDETVVHEPDFDNAVLFSFRAKSIFGKKKTVHKLYGSDSDDATSDASSTATASSATNDKKMKKKEKEKKKKKPKEKKRKQRHFRKKGKINLQVKDSAWSDKFSLDTVGSCGRCTCKTPLGTYEVGVGISLSSYGLTKIVTFMPYFMLINKSKLPLLCHELADGADWLAMPPGEAIPFWPRQPPSKNMLLRCKVDDPVAKLVTQPFPFYESHNIFMKLEKKYAGIFVEVATNDEATLISFQDYQPGMALVLIVNNMDDHNISYHQQGVNSNNVLSPGKMVLYTWEDAQQKKELVWQCGQDTKKTFTNKLNVDGIEDFPVNFTKGYWVSFMWETQRVLLFTSDINVAKNARLSMELEQIDQEITLSLQALGISLVNDITKEEVSYISVTSSGVKWNQVRRKNRMRPLRQHTSDAVEAAYDNYVNQLRTNQNPSDVVKLATSPSLEIDLSKRMVLKPEKCELVRTFEPGIYVQYKTSPHQQHIHMRIYRVQVDNQRLDCTFPVVFAPVAPPKSLALDNGPKPLIEFSAVIGSVSNNVSRFKYFRILIQEMQLKVDQGYLNAIIDFFSETVAEFNEEKAFKTDVKMIQDKLMETKVIENIIQAGRKNMFDNFHISPIKMHVSFSLAGGSQGDKKMGLQSEMLNLFLQSVGIALTDVQDVLFKLAYFEKQNALMTNQQLSAEMVRHYANQGMKQMYVLVLGLDVLGNPFGVIRGMAQGVEDLFYEPVRGAVLGPEEFAEGVALGVRSLFGHAVGGVSGAMSRITGTLGKGIAALTLDEDYQRKRREGLNRRPESMGAGLAQGGKGLVMGVVHGVTGIVTKPVEGAKKEGVEGFFKGMGKGIVGVVTRPVSGVVDFASSSFEGIRRATDTAQEVVRVRPPRNISHTGVIYPYDRREAEGNVMLKSLDKSKFPLDSYEYHVYVKNTKQSLLLTNKHIILVERNDILGTWSTEWALTFAEMASLPKATGSSIVFTTKEKQKKLFSAGNVTKEIEMDPYVAGAMIEKIKTVMDSNT